MSVLPASPACHALIVAAGRGARFGGEIPKQYCRLGGAAVLRRTVLAFAGHPGIRSIRIAIHPDDHTLYQEAVGDLPLPVPVAGGATRQDSVRALLETLDAVPDDLVLIHDAGRPLVAARTIDRVIEALSRIDGAIAALPVADTLKRADGPRIADTVDRTGLWQAQTPQGFRYGMIRDAHRRCAGMELTDDAAVFEQAGHPVELVMGDPDNFKITTQADLARAERLLGGGAETRTGSGFDVHRLVEGDGCWINGIRIPHDRALLGHSDADVGLHALTDALLGAIGAGDIGLHFPPSDPRWRGAPSDRFLRHAADLVAAKGGTIVSCDVTVICERPKIGPHRAAMVRRVAEILGIAEARVSVKATTTEGLGFTGRGEGIAAQAIASVRLPVAGG
jgi:2-C-methyl-D-erythritol 4-phosphate cytidylyltransferase/2-C-methyl-D-erythritol 2,4-cyclodiphosphate synthase